jgi:hypothetical protein
MNINTENDSDLDVIVTRKDVPSLGPGSCRRGDNRGDAEARRMNVLPRPA